MRRVLNDIKSLLYSYVGSHRKMTEGGGVLRSRSQGDGW